MTTQLASSSSTTTTPAWDSRNSSFISPTRLQQLRQKQPRHHFTSSPQQPPTTSSPSDSMAATEQPQRPSTGDRHGRASSFFSFNRKQQQQQQQQPESANVQRTPSLLSRTQSNTLNGADSPPITRAPAPPSTNGTTLARSTSGPSAPAQPPQLHPEIRSVVGLTVAHAHKVYLSGPLVRKIERNGDGQKPTKEEGWNEVWAQLGGTTLSIWDMKQIQEASSQNREVPPTYVNVTDAVSTFNIFCHPSHAVVVRRGPWIDNCSSNTNHTGATLRQRSHTQHRWFKPTALLMSIYRVTYLMGRCFASMCLGKIPSRGNIYRSSNKDNS